jgi:hypothetical protein
MTISSSGEGKICDNCGQAQAVKSILFDAANIEIHLCQADFDKLKTLESGI